jgi:CobQ-like glutamine amidotransferase family enzyme
MMTASSVHVVIVHLFPELLNLYGDRGNIATLAHRASWRGFEVETRGVEEDDGAKLKGADVVFIGGGPDRQQIAAAKGLDKLAGPLREAVAEGASLVAVCGGYQNVGHRYHSSLAGDLAGPGILDVWTEAPDGSDRVVGGVELTLEQASPIAAAGRDSAKRAGFGGQERTIVGFENHSGRTVLGPGVRPLGAVTPGHGNTGSSGGEGAVAMPGEGGIAGLRMGTYLHGPVLPRNPHLADFVLLCALARKGVTELAQLPDEDEWQAHVSFADRWREVAAAGTSRR